MARRDNSSDKLKFSEWRPIGVCDNAPPGVQKAQMFTREDFLIITAPGVDRTNWRKNPQVRKILNRYAVKLARQSTKTSGMIQPQVSKMNLVGAVMKLVVTPTLNKESQDGKLQLFQIEFEDGGKTKKKKKPWLLILGILIAILAILCILLGIVLYQKSQSRHYKVRRLSSPSNTISFCKDPLDRNRYDRQLDEVNRILQLKADDLLYQGRIAAEPNCVEIFHRQSLKEERFLACYALVRRYGMLAQIPSSDLKKVRACQKEICRRNRSSRSPACLRQ